MSFDYDLFVIGAGSGGVRASRMSAGFGAKVAIVENTYMGGTCVNVGCVPKKLFVYGSHFSEEFADAVAFGWQHTKPGFDWPTLRDNKTREIERLNGIYDQILDTAGVKVYRGTASFVDNHSLDIDGKVVTADKILIATGSWPSVPSFPGNDLVITSNEAFYLEHFPEKVVVVGGGYIAVEFAGIFNGLGADTELVYRGPLFLRNFDESVRKFVKSELAEKGIKLTFNTNVQSIVAQGEQRLITFEDGKQATADLVLYATGRRPNLTGLNIEASGVELTAKGAVAVNDYFQTNVDNIYALGDVIDRMQLTPVAIAEGMCLAANLFADENRKLSYDDIPTAVFCQPNIGTVGLTEEQAAATTEIDVYESVFKPMKHTLTNRAEKTLMKLIVDRKSDRVLGAHMVGPEAGEITQGLGIALKAGATKAQFDATIGIHPTSAEEFVTMREVRK